MGTEPIIEALGIHVPIQYLPKHAAVVLLHGVGRALPEELFTDAHAARAFGDHDVLEVEPTPLPRGVPFVADGHPDDNPFGLGHPANPDGIRAETRFVHVIHGDRDLLWCALEQGQFMYELEHPGHITRFGAANDVVHAHKGKAAASLHHRLR